MRGLLTTPEEVPPAAWVAEPFKPESRYRNPAEQLCPEGRPINGTSGRTFPILVTL
jgi:hypothetical protein